MNNKLKMSNKTLLKTTLASSMALMFMSSPVAQAQTVVPSTQTISSCDSLPLDIGDNGDDSGQTFFDNVEGTLTIDIAGTCELDTGAGSNSQGGIILVEEDADGLTIDIASGTTLINNNNDDDDTVIFLDSNEANNIVNIEAGATISGDDGVISVSYTHLTLPTTPYV